MKHYTKRIKYEISQRYHSFIIIEQAPTIVTKIGRTYTSWKCQCDCGNIFITTTKQIQKGIRKSCGCLSKSNRFKKLPSKEVIGGVKFGHYRACANRRNIIWKLTKEQFIDFIFKKCYYCGSEPSLVTKTKCHSEKTNGIDRIDSDKPYVIDNCVTCCKPCNCAKGNMSLQDFIAWIERLKNYENSSY